MGKKGKVRASHILNKHSVIMEAKKKLENGMDFKKLAKNYSECPSKKRGGDLGWFGRGKMVPEFEKAVYRLSVGEVSEPIKTQFGWHLIKRTG